MFRRHGPHPVGVGWGPRGKAAPDRELGGLKRVPRIGMLMSKETPMPRNTSVVLSDHFNEFITRAVESGRYNSASDVVRAGLRMLEAEEEKLQRLRAELQKGIDSGFIEDFDFDEFLADMNAKHRA
jgi:antitoxin ParD1/3/4